jgi:hypothetical protein
MAKFYYRSFCDSKVSGYSLAGSTDYIASTLPSAVDRNRSTAAYTTGKNSDSTNVDFIVDLLFNRSIDTIAVRSNFKNFTIKTWDGIRVDTAQVDKITGVPTDGNSSVYVMINSTTFTLKPSAFWEEGSFPDMNAVFAMLLGLINASSEPVTATYINPGNFSEGIYITSDTVGGSFTSSITGNDGTLALANHIASVTAWHTFSTHTNNTSEFVMDELVAPITDRYIKVSCTATITANQEKYLKEISITKKICELSISEMPTAESMYVRISKTNLKGRSIQLILFPDFPTFHIQLNFKNMTDRFANYDLLKKWFIVDSILGYFYFSDTIKQLGYDALYLLNDIVDENFTPDSNVTIGGANGSMELVEV